MLIEQNYILLFNIVIVTLRLKITENTNNRERHSFRIENCLLYEKHKFYKNNNNEHIFVMTKYFFSRFLITLTHTYIQKNNIQ